MTALTIAQAAQSSIEAASIGNQLASGVLNKVASYMDAAEKLENSTLTGAQKRDWVIEFVKKEITEIFTSIDHWLPLIIKFINTAKTAFNAWKDFIKLI